MSSAGTIIGRVTRCSTRGFVGALRRPQPEVPVFGDFCQAEAQGGDSEVIGLIYDLSVADDEFARQLATAEHATAEQIADGQQNRQVPVEFSALALGYQRGDSYARALPPQPPLTLAPIRTLGPAAVRDFTSDFAFLPLILGAEQVPAEDLLAAALKRAAEAHPSDRREAFLIEAGRACAHYLRDDFARLDRLLRLLKPGKLPFQSGS